MGWGVAEGAKIWATGEEAIPGLPELREGGSGPVLLGPVIDGAHYALWAAAWGH